MDKIRSGQSFLYRKQGYNSTVIEVRMKDEVRGNNLQEALGKAAKRFPYLTDKLVEKSGSYYLHHDDVSMNAVLTERLRSLGSMETGYHLLDVTYTKNIIRVAFHHALCDGRGIKPFVETLIYYYCSLRYQKSFSAEGIHTVQELSDRAETVEPIGTDFFAVDEDKVMNISNDGFALPETTSTPTSCYRTEIQVNEREFVDFAKKNGATPGVMAAILFSSTIYGLHPEADKPIICSMAIDLRAAIGMEKTHRNCTASVYLPYAKEQANSDLSAIAAEYRRLLSSQKSNDSVMQLLNKQIGLFNKVDSLNTLEEKRSMLSFFNNLCVNTYVISYLGKMNFNDFGQYVVSTHLYSDGIKGVTVNMVAAGDTISFDILQGFDSDIYAKTFLTTLDKFGISYKAKDKVVMMTGKDKSYITASRQAERYYL